MAKETAQEYFERTAPPYMARFQKEMGCGKWDTCAVFGNSGHESLGWTAFQEFKPVVAGSRGGWGWMQWTGPRRVAFETFCAAKGLKLDDHEANYLFLVHELKNTWEKKAMAAIFKDVSLERKVETFDREFLRSGVKNIPSRVKWARIALAAYERYLAEQGRDAPPEPVKPPPITPAPVPPAEVEPLNPGKPVKLNWIVVGAVVIALAFVAGVAIWQGVLG